MSSYYNRVIGSLNASEIARSEDIHLIQSGVQSAIQEMIRDMFGAGCILGEEENSLKVTSTPYHIDQENHNYDEDENLISFYDRYFRQIIDIDKSEIQSINVELQNTSEIEPTIYAEIRDTNFNLLKETNITLTPTKSGPEVFSFNFNLNHLPLGEYYFCIRPVDITSANLQNKNNIELNTINSETFKIRFDRSGNYKEGLEASYNGVDFLEARLLGDQVNTDSMSPIPYDNNFDLWFEHVFSSGNTYTVETAPCIVMGEKVYPIDTHVTLDGPSSEGDRVDLITLTPDGYLNVVKGLPFIGTKGRDNYPIEDTGLKIAYITTYQTSEPWTCPNCHTINDANIKSCSECGTASISTKIPLIEQNDENGMTRTRDILERIRRLEKRMNYNEDHNIPSRIKYTCDIDPTLIIDPPRGENNELESKEDSYGMSVKEDEDGNKIVSASNIESTKTLEWTIINKVTTTTTNKVNTPATLTIYNLTIPTNAPKSINKKNHYLHAKVINKKTKKGMKDVPLTFTIKNSNKKVVKTVKNVKTASDGTISLNIWTYKLKKGTYTVTVSHTNTKTVNVSATLKLVGDNYTKASNSKSATIQVATSEKTTTTDEIDTTKTFVGDDSFYKDGGITLDATNGVVTLSENTPTKDSFKSKSNLTSDQTKNLNYSTQQYKINKTSSSLQSEYAALSFQIDKKCNIKSITPSIKKFKNIKAFTIILFKNDKVFNIDTTRKSYTKNTKPKADKTFTDIYNVSNDKNKWVNLKKKGKKDNKGIITLKKAHEFTFKETTLEPGTYTMAVLGILDNPKEDGIIYIKQYHTSKATKYGAASRLKGTSSTQGPKKLYIEANSLTNRTWYFSLNKADINHQQRGTLISKTVTTQSDINSVTISPNFYIPDGCSITTYISNNGGKTYVETKPKGTTTFNGTGRDFKWRLELEGTQNAAPKLYYKSSDKYAIRFTLNTTKKYVGYEDYGRCFCTPILNANAITTNVLENSLIENKFEEWEYCRLWMEDKDLNARIDICFSYANDDNVTNIKTPQKKWPTTMFFSQVFANLSIEDFTQESVDYDNYTANVEPDEHNYRFKLNSDYIGNAKSEIITTPLANLNPTNYNYQYQDITNEEYNIGEYFSYGIMESSTTYKANVGNTNNISTGLHLLSGPYYQAMFNPNLQAYTTNTEEEVEEETPTSTPTEGGETPTEGGETPTEPTSTPNSEVQTKTESVCVWASDSEYNIEYMPEACIIGISFSEGLEINDNHTHLVLDVIPNLRDCKEVDTNTGALKLENGEPILDNPSDTTKYQYGTGHMYAKSYYIPADTLEIVAALNPYGLIEDGNGIYGKAFTIKQDLISCKHNEVLLDLSDLYGSTVYSIGIRVSTQKDKDGNYLVKWEEPKEGSNGTRKHPSLHAGDIIGIGNLYFESFNKRSYAKYLYSGNTNRWNWTASTDKVDSKVFGQYHMKLNSTESEETPYWSQFNLETKDKDDTALNIYNKSGTKLYDTNYAINTFKYDGGNITTTFRDTTNNSTDITEYYNTNETGDIIFFLAEGETGNLFEIDVDIPLTPYDYIDIQYHLDHPGQDSEGTERGIAKGDIIIDLYDVDDIHKQDPIESLPLPAWGRVQNKAVISNNDKTVNAWFKKHTDAITVKKIVLRRVNATNETSPSEFKLHLTDILFVNTPTLPSLGPQMHVRIYPKDMTNLENTKIRKFGCVYRLG